MLFPQREFALFLVLLLVLTRALPSGRPRKGLLLAASYYFYAYWDWRFLGLILFSTAVDYLAGGCIAASTRPRRRKAFLGLSLAANLGLLGFFKYYGFFVESARALVEPLGWSPAHLELILPVGISFYTFQTLSYTIDVYRGVLRPCRSPLDFALYVAFFPQLVAGPIVRAREFLPQLAEDRRPTWPRLFAGFTQFAVGLFKKVFIADNLALYVDEVFGHAGAYDGLTTWLAVIAYAVQIYGDFSGYSDMAIGTARMLGYDFNRNFDHPYLAASPADFWRRWHISLSTWLRDYLYIPLGGNRRGPARTYINLLLTMLLGGLWHGAAWTFVAWGAIHGAALALHRALFGSKGRPSLDAPRFTPPAAEALRAGGDSIPPETGSRHGAPGGGPKRRWRALAYRFAGWALTMLIVLVAWVFFRAHDFENAARMLGQMATLGAGVRWLHPFSLFAMLLMAAAHGLHGTPWARLRRLEPEAWYTPVVVFLLLWLTYAFPPRGFTPFIYFQF